MSVFTAFQQLKRVTALDYCKHSNDLNSVNPKTLNSKDLNDNINNKRKYEELTEDPFVAEFMANCLTDLKYAKIPTVVDEYYDIEYDDEEWYSPKSSKTKRKTTKKAKKVKQQAKSKQNIIPKRNLTKNVRHSMPQTSARPIVHETKIVEVTNAKSDDEYLKAIHSALMKLPNNRGKTLCLLQSHIKYSNWNEIS